MKLLPAGAISVEQPASHKQSAPNTARAAFDLSFGVLVIAWRGISPGEEHQCFRARGRNLSHALSPMQLDCLAVGQPQLELKSKNRSSMLSQRDRVFIDEPTARIETERMRCLRDR